MAQAARLSLRMQKELKLLLTDPPPGVSLPMLSSDVSDLSSSSSSPNLSSIDACIEGPEGTVYAKGVFKIKIQIPERYPFQPPSVTFGTPIYHPNIDNGGRICLDILNLPPKGAWQPSLNISTVLTSIGLLLSEPNPDDGLMCEASREYKYNRQTFDQKARTLTERYAKAGCSGGGQSTPLDPNPSSTENGVNLEFINVETEENASCKKLSGVRRKLSLESSGPSQRRNTEGTVTRSHELSPSQMQDLSEVCPSAFMPMPQVDSNDEQPTHQVHVGKPGTVSTSASSKRLSRINDKRSSSLPTQRRKNNEKESMELIPKSSVSQSETLFMASSESSLPVVGTAIKHQSEEISEGAQESNPLCPPLRRADGRDSHIASVASSRLSLMRQSIANCSSQQLDHVHNKVENDGINMSIKKQCEIIRTRPLKDSSTSQASDSYNSVESHSLTSYRKTLHPRSTTSSNSVIQQTSNCDEPEPPQDHGARKKLFGISRKLCLGSTVPSSKMDFDDKENVDPLQKFSLANSHIHPMNIPKSPPMPQCVRSDVEQLHQCKVAANENTKQHYEEGSPVNDAVIVLDSEDSDEEQNAPKRSRLSLAGRRCLIGKAKASR